jgi:hypothetical protein
MIRLTLILVFFSQIFLTFHPDTYECKKKGRVYRLKLNEDSTYYFTHPSIFHNDLVTDTGKWRYINDTLFLIDSITHEYSKTGEKGEYVKGQNFVSIKVVDEQNNPFANIEVGLNYDQKTKKTDSSGIVKFDYSEIKKVNHPHKDTIITILSIGKDSSGVVKFDDSGLKNMFRNQMDYAIVDMTIGNGEWPGLDTYVENVYANHFTVILDLNPIYKREIRFRKFVVNNDIIVFENTIYRKGEHIIKLKKKKVNAL